MRVAGMNELVMSFRMEPQELCKRGRNSLKLAAFIASVCRNQPPGPVINPSWELGRVGRGAKNPTSARNQVWAMTTTKGVATDALARHLHAAIERVREDMEKVEFWADAMTSFSEPV